MRHRDGGGLHTVDRAQPVGDGVGDEVRVAVHGLVDHH